MFTPGQPVVIGGVGGGTRWDHSQNCHPENDHFHWVHLQEWSVMVMHVFCRCKNTITMGFAIRVRSAGQKYGPTCHQRDRADITEFVTLVRLSSLGQHVGVLALARYKRRKSALTADPILRSSSPQGFLYTLWWFCTSQCTSESDGAGVSLGVGSSRVGAGEAGHVFLPRNAKKGGSWKWTLFCSLQKR